MRTGALCFSTDVSVRPDVLGRDVEEAGFEILLFPDHTHVPVHLESRWPGGGDLPESYARIFDPFISMSWALSATTDLIVGTGVALMAQRDPIVTAKQTASLDLLSGGRTVLGIGAGWSREEAANHGVVPAERWAVMREHMLAVKEIWMNEIASFDGAHVHIEPMRSWPKPARHPHPPVLVGGNGPTVLDRVLELGDVWYPSPAKGLPPMRDRVAELRQRAEEAGRPCPEVWVQVFGDGPGVADVVRSYEDAGVDAVIFGLPSAPRDEVRRALDSLRRHVAVLAPGAG
jgi:probable F420-dependent oxidoreductase